MQIKWASSFSNVHKFTIEYRPSAAKIMSAWRTHVCNSVVQFRSLKSIGITFTWHLDISRLFRRTFFLINCKIPPISISVQQTFRSEWMAATMLVNPTPDPISRMFRLTNLCRLWKIKSASINAPRHTCNPTSVKSVDFWCSISMASLRLRFTITSPSSSYWQCVLSASSASSA